MGTYIDEINGKNDSDKTEHIDTENEYTITVSFDCVMGRSPLEVAKTISEWLKNGAEKMIYDVTNDDTKEKFTVDLSEEDEADAVQPNND